MKVAINQVVGYKGHSVKQSGAVTLTLSARFDEITHSMQLLRLLNEDVTIKAKVPNRKPALVGTFLISGINFAKDGKSTIKLVSINTAVDTEVLNSIVETLGIDFIVRYEGNVETDEDEE